MIDFEKLRADGEPKWWNAFFDRSLKESFLLDQASKYFLPAPRLLFADDPASERINEKISQLNRLLGGAPKVFLIRGDARPTERYDEFTFDAVDQMVGVFHRARASVIKTHATYCALFVVTEAGDNLGGMTADQAAAFKPILREDFWNHAEVAYIRLASLWDRVGQLLDYVFFNIRQFERDGFPSVFDRIKVNFSVVDRSLAERAFWNLLKDYATGEKEDGLKWLLRRRNLLVHSLHLSDTQDKEKEAMELRYYYNHLEEAVRTKLAAKSPEEELAYLHRHLAAFADRLEAIFDLCIWGAELIGEMRRKKETFID